MIQSIILFLEPIVFQLYLVFRLYVQPFWYSVLRLFMNDKLKYFVVVKRSHACAQYTLTPNNYMDISSVSSLTDYFLLVRKVSYLPDGVVKQYLVVQKDAFAILPGQTLQQSADQVRLLKDMYGSDAIVPSKIAFLGGECAQGTVKQCVNMDEWCVLGNILFTPLFRSWIWSHHAKQPLLPGIAVDVSLIDQNINQLHLDERECIEITSDGYKKISKTI